MIEHSTVERPYSTLEEVSDLIEVSLAEFNATKTEAFTSIRDLFTLTRTFRSVPARSD